MSETTATVVVGGHVLAVGGHAGTLIELPAAGGEAPELAAALKRPGAGTAAKDVVDAVSEATGRIEKAAARFEAVADGSIDISEASDVIDGVIGLLEQLDRERHHQEALNVARAVNGLLALAMRWAELARSLGIAVDVARRIGARAAEGSAEQIGARAGEAWAQHELGTLHLAAGDQVAADRLLSEARRLRRELGDREGLAATEHNLGVLCRRVAGDGRLVRRSRRLLVAAAASLLLLAGGVGGAVIASRDDEELIGAVAHLTVQVDGPGTVESSPAGIDCPDECERAFTPRTKIVLTPEPDDGATFEGWSGACSDTPCVLRARRDRTVDATFREEEGPQQPEMATLAVDPPVDGRVTSTDEGIDCGDDCSEDYELGQPVTLEATPDPGFLFSTWRGECPDDDGPCPLTMDEDLIVSATFTPKRTISVTVSGDGTVTSTPAGIECTAGPTCSWTFRADDGQVVLTAAGGTFLGWGGDCEERGIETTCTLSLDADHRADASFSSPTPEAEP